jgi:cytochrome b561
LHWRNTETAYGLVSIVLHWLVAALAIGLFGLGVWMVELDYYDPWYRQAPWLHKSLGVVLFGIVLLRVLWRHTNWRPVPIGSALQTRAALAVHALLYLALLALPLSGYLISTADGRAVEVFGMLRVPATLSGLDGQEDIAGRVHQLLGLILMSLTGLHAAAALKHHFVDHDRTLRRMLSPDT